jgi:hypothetical protein
MNTRCKVLLVDKKGNFLQLFKGFRKNKFAINSVSSVLKSSEIELNETSIFFVVLYEPKDIIQIVKLSNITHSIIVGTVNKRLFQSFRTIRDYPIVDLSTNVNIMTQMHEAIKRIWN